MHYIYYVLILFLSTAGVVSVNLGLEFYRLAVNETLFCQYLLVAYLAVSRGLLFTVHSVLFLTLHSD